MNTALAMILLATCSLLVAGAGATTAPLADARLDHVAITVRDASTAASLLARILGLPVPATTTSTVGAARLKTAVLATSDFLIELNEPVGGSGPTQQFLQQLGPGIEHIGFVADSIATRVADMERLGGTRISGDRDTRVLLAFPSIGGIEISRRDAVPAAAPPQIPAGALATQKGSHVGFIYRNAQPVVDTFARLLGVAAPALTLFRPIDYRSGDPSNPGAHLRYSFFRVPGVTVEVIEPIGGPSPWMDFVTARPAGGAHHLAFSVSAPQDEFDALLTRLQALGGRWRKGERGYRGSKTGSSPEFEFLDTLGIVVETSRVSG